MQLNGQLVPVHEDAGLCLEESINVFESPISSLRIEEVCDRNERETDDSPDNPELVAEVLNARQCGLYDSVVTDPYVELEVLLVALRSAYLQLVLIANDAPFVRISRALIL